MAVCAAYGMGPDDDPIQRRFDLNQAYRLWGERGEAIAGPGLLSFVNDPEAFHHS
jgi:hypothetical protein